MTAGAARLRGWPSWAARPRRRAAHPLILSISDRSTPVTGDVGVISITSAGEDIPEWVRRHHAAHPERTLHLVFDDVHEHAHPHAARADHVTAAIAFARRQPAGSRVHLHCSAGVSRSPALAAVILAHTQPQLGPPEVAAQIRHLRPACEPNTVVLELGARVIRADLRRGFRSWI